jgi:hypothetical protein
LGAKKKNGKTINKVRNGKQAEMDPRRQTFSREALQAEGFWETQTLSWPEQKAYKTTIRGRGSQDRLFVSTMKT